jgi:hypothetical protein
VIGILLVVATIDDEFEPVSTTDEDVSSLTPSCLHSTPTPMALIDYCVTAGNTVSGIQHHNNKAKRDEKISTKEKFFDIRFFGSVIGNTGTLLFLAQVGKSYIFVAIVEVIPEVLLEEM